MIFYDNTFSTSPYFNLALEEYFFKQIKEDSIILWQSKNAIVVGKHQNALAEINLPFALENNIDIVRRLSGGGTVFHDLGNLNFTFIQTGEKEKLVDFSRFLKPIIMALAELGIEASQGKRNELLVDGKKISGNAEHTFKNRVLHHGTLLFNSNLSTLIKSLRINPLKYQDKAIKSVQSRVVNIQDHLSNTDFNTFRKSLKNSLMQQFEIECEYELNENDKLQINTLEKEKYRTWDWNYGYSPSYTLNKILNFNGQNINFKIEVKKGEILNIESDNDSFYAIIKNLIGQAHRPNVLEPIANKLKIDVMQFF